MLRLAVALASVTLTAVALTGCTAPTAPSPSATAPSAAQQTTTPGVTDTSTPAATDQATPGTDAELYADAALADMTLREKVQSMFMLHYPGTSSPAIRAFVKKYKPGGLILMGDNVPTPAARLAKLTAKVNPDTGLPLLIGIDQEGGIVRRIPTDTAASPSQLRDLPPAQTRAAFASRSALLEKLGVTINFGIVADETSDTASFIYDRVLGTTPADAAARVAKAVDGEQGAVLSTLKHFPGHGVTEGDSHTGIPATSLGLSKWRSTVAKPFAAGIDAGAEAVMFGHLRFTAVDDRPATLSKKWHTILRDDLGFNGLMITDDMLMLQRSGDPEFADPSRNAIRAIAAGNTMLLYVLPADPASAGIRPTQVVSDVVKAVQSGRLSESTIDAAAHQLLVVRREQSSDTGEYIP